MRKVYPRSNGSSRRIIVLSQPHLCELGEGGLEVFDDSAAMTSGAGRAQIR